RREAASHQPWRVNADDSCDAWSVRWSAGLRRDRHVPWTDAGGIGLQPFRAMDRVCGREAGERNGGLMAPQPTTTVAAMKIAAHLPKEKIWFQSFFMLITSQPLALASS